MQMAMGSLSGATSEREEIFVAGVGAFKPKVDFVAGDFPTVRGVVEAWPTFVLAAALGAVTGVGRLSPDDFICSKIL